MKVLMVGATRKYASHVIPELKQRGVIIRALVRDKDKLEAARHQGADEAIVGDLGDTDSLYAAASGVEGVFHLNPAFASTFVVNLGNSWRVSYRLLHNFWESRVQLLLESVLTHSPLQEHWLRLKQQQHLIATPNDQ
ncbi:MAG: hypothetical protein RLZZ135_1590 [Cyanobacteriota bacterium]|jgi:nucleoside-diphosphate-sugar epimerase